MLAHGPEFLAAACEDLVNVALMTDIKEDLVRRCFKDTVEGDGEFHHPEVGPEVAPGFRKGSYELVTDLPGKLGKIPLGEFLEIGGRVDPVQKVR
jgi:hypothetical protein